MFSLKEYRSRIAEAIYERIRDPLVFKVELKGALKATVGESDNSSLDLLRTFLEDRGLAMLDTANIRGMQGLKGIFITVARDQVPALIEAMKANPQAVEPIARLTHWSGFPDWISGQKVIYENSRRPL